MSFECTPDVADDAEATIVQAAELWHRLALRNVMIKVPATEAGVPAIEELTARGVNVNVTLLFSVDRYEQVIEAFLPDWSGALSKGQPIASLRSVASFFISRVDAKVDPLLDCGIPASRSDRYRECAPRLRAVSGAVRGRALGAAAAAGRVAAAAVVGEHRHERQGLLGRRLRRATDRSGGHQYHARSDSPAFDEHGKVQPFDADSALADRTLDDAASAGVDLGAITTLLEHEGVQAFRTPTKSF